jgi:aryl-alcohol dehydrogenase-like predicted oxidoreductase
VFDHLFILANNPPEDVTPLTAIYMVVIQIALAIALAVNVRAMQLTRLGSSDLLVSKVCLGTMTWGQQNTIDEAHAQLDVAFDECGVNFLDTAEMYPVPTKKETQGETDRYIGAWLAKRDRSKVILATKVAGPGITWLPGRNGHKSRVTAKEIELSVDSSLQRLGTEYIDLLQIHWPDRYVPIFGSNAYDMSLERDAISFEEQLTAMDRLIKAGKVRYFGVSNETPYGVMKFSHLADTLGMSKLVSIQKFLANPV